MAKLMGIDFGRMMFVIVLIAALIILGSAFAMPIFMLGGFVLIIWLVLK